MAQKMHTLKENLSTWERVLQWAMSQTASVIRPGWFSAEPQHDKQAVNIPKERLGTKCYTADTTDSLDSHNRQQVELLKSFDGDDDRLKIWQLSECCCDSWCHLGEEQYPCDWIMSLSRKVLICREEKKHERRKQSQLYCWELSFYKMLNVPRGLPSYNWLSWPGSQTCTQSSSWC